ncbi:hypothetical protein MSG28_011956 [Choristoneura fumiferana]|uniref:Uncharacterized protein n=1 Tax=Choristoneura fumiferana TaxID=7141 RepID=A0ACC0KMH1_CHOFU|nr:hypothetical protein MSG28_011956 [Choristoneura fumiferana]
MLKIKVSVRKALGQNETDDCGLATELASILLLWDDAHQRTSNELLALEKAVCAWAEWESALRELQGALRGDMATLEALRDRPVIGDQTEVTAQIRQLAASLVDKKKRMEQTENEVRTLQESCRVLVEQSIPDLKIKDETERSVSAVFGKKTGSGDPDYTPRSGWVWRVLRSSLPIQLCLVALLLAAWLVERPRCCDALNSLAQTLTPQLRYVRGPPPV